MTKADQGSVRGDTRFTVSFYQNGRRIRRTFDSLAKATEEARMAAMKILQGLAEVADMRVADQQKYHAATALLEQFEAIHPLLIGNGRVGRLLITLLLMQCGVLPPPHLYLSAFFEATGRDYYDGLRAVIERSAPYPSAIRPCSAHQERWGTATHPLRRGSSRNRHWMSWRLR